MKAIQHLKLAALIGAPITLLAILGVISRQETTSAPPSAPMSTTKTAVSHRAASTSLGKGEVATVDHIVIDQPAGAQISAQAPRAFPIPSFASGFRDIEVGEVISLPDRLLGEISGTVESVIPDSDGATRIGGTTEPKGSFLVAMDREGHILGGFIEIVGRNMVTKLERDQHGGAVSTEVPLETFRCAGMPTAPPLPGRLLAAEPEFLAVQTIVVPAYDSLPSAEGVLYLDFDGQTVTDPAWYGGKAIKAAPATLNGKLLTSAQILKICQAVAEDFSSIANVSVTTNAARYDKAPVGKRMRCIITPTKAWLGSSAATTGGVAYLDTFARKYPTYQSTSIPCWCFDQAGADERNVVMTISHEIGHTFGLKHDGRLKATYYVGHGIWGPIMGAPFNQTIVQWSKCDYTGATNVEDDIAIITSAANKAGPRPDDIGNSVATAKVLANTGTFSASGALGNYKDTDWYAFTAGAGPMSVTVTMPWSSAWMANTDFVVGVYNATTRLARQSPTTTSATLNFTIPKAGTYYLVVRPSGYGDINTTGYSAYGSAGYYRVSGTYPKK